MATTKSIKMVQSQLQINAEKFALAVEHGISNAVIKTATPTRAQTRIQVRVAYTNINNKPALGYYSVLWATAEMITRCVISGKPHNQSPVGFLDSVFRIVHWSGAMGEGSPNYFIYHFRQYMNQKSDVIKNRIVELHEEAISAIVECIKSGQHTRARNVRQKAKAREYLGGAIQFAIQNGLKDAEINECIKLAFVRHTMESIDNMTGSDLDCFYAGCEIGPVGTNRFTEVDYLLSHTY